jgi:hypothetical protein
MKLLSYSGSKPQNVEDGIGGGSLSLATDPLLHIGQAPGSLVDIVALRDIGDGLDQLLEAFVPLGSSGRALRRTGATPSGTTYGARCSEMSHPTTFLIGASRH